MADDVLAPFEAEADKAQEVYERDAKAVATDANLSESGKAQRMAEVEQRRRAAVDGIQGRAVEAVADRAAAVTMELDAVVAAETRKERERIGAAIAFQLAEREVTLLEDDELVPYVADAGDDWTRQVRGELVRFEFKRRMKAQPTESLAMEYGKLLQMQEPPNPKVTALRDELAGLANPAWRINALNRKAYADEIRQKLGFTGPAPLV